MGAEERWAQQKEWDNERGEMEINYTVTAPDGYVCDVRKCSAPATREVEVKRVEDPCGTVLRVCAAHEDSVFDLFRKQPGADPDDN